jgi:hypothetical protein
MDTEFVIVTKYYLSQQSQHQHFLMIWKNPWETEDDEENDENDL